MPKFKNKVFSLCNTFLITKTLFPNFFEVLLRPEKA